MGVRYYAPYIGRWITEAPYKGSIDDPLSLNLYVFVRNSPLIYVDPSGHFAIAIPAASAIKGFTVALGVIGAAVIVEEATDNDGGLLNYWYDELRSGAAYVWDQAKSFGAAIWNSMFDNKSEPQSEPVSSQPQVVAATPPFPGGNGNEDNGNEGDGKEKGTGENGTEGTRSTVDPNKLNHIFGKKEHNLDTFLSKFGGDQVKAYNALEKVTQQYVNSNKITGTFKDIIVNVNGVDVTVRGTVINGQVKIGTAFIP